MRLLHTSDWHLGRSFHGVPLLADQLGAIDHMVQLVRSEAIDVVLVAGDIYDRQLPPADAVEALSYALCELRGAGARVVGIAGNHDSSVRLGFAEPVLAAGGVSIRGDVSTAGTPVVVGDDGNGVAVYPVPYLEPEVARHRLGAPDSRTSDALLRVALERVRADLAGRRGMRSVVVAHAFVSGGRSCDSERALTVGGSAEVALASFGDFDYVALGHLHGRQVLGDGRVRYAGSLLPYSFSERSHTKGVWIIDLPRSGPATVLPADLPLPRPLAVVTGTLDELLTDRGHAPAERAWVQAVLTDTELPSHAMARLRVRFPHAVNLVHEPPPQPEGTTTSYRRRVRGRSDLDLALDFLAHVTGQPVVDGDGDELRRAIDAVNVAEVGA